MGLDRVPAITVTSAAGQDSTTGEGRGMSESVEQTVSDEVVDEVLRRLENLDDAPLREHVDAFEAVHATLQDRLAEAED